jgi:hypothetical protein
MGGSRWDSGAWDTRAAATAHKPAASIFASTSLHESLDPAAIKIRESVDSEANPNSTPIIITCDVTGSMGVTAEVMIKKGCGLIFKEIYDRKPVPDPHIMFAATGDANFDSAPLQMTQFEASIVLADQLERVWIEAGGGGNSGESYHLPWYAAAHMVRADAIMKRKQKGWIFTIGDEAPLDLLTEAQIKKVFGVDRPAMPVTSKELLAQIEPYWNVFHLIIQPVSHQQVLAKWRDLLQERAIMVGDHNHLPEVIVSTMQVIQGEDARSVAASWSGDTSMVVHDAIKGLVPGSAVGQGVVRL